MQVREDPVTEEGTISRFIFPIWSVYDKGIIQ